MGVGCASDWWWDWEDGGGFLEMEKRWCWRDFFEEEDGGCGRGMWGGEVGGDGGLKVAGLGTVGMVTVGGVKFPGLNE